MPLPNNPHPAPAFTEAELDAFAEMTTHTHPVITATQTPTAPQPDPDATAAVIAHLMNQPLPNPFEDMPANTPTQPATATDLPPWAWPTGPQLVEVQPFTFNQATEPVNYKDDNYYKDYGMTMKTKKPKTAKPKKEKGKKMDKYLDGKLPDDLSTIISIYGQSFDDSTRDEWLFHEGLGWLYHTERYAFSDDYKLCAINDRYVSTSSVINGLTKDEFGDFKNCFIQQSAAMEHKWFKCQATNRYCAPQYKLSIRRVPDEMMDICSGVKDRHALRCDYTKELWASGVMMKVKDSHTFKLVNKWSLLESGKFGKCANCGSWFEKDALTAHPGILHGTPICDSCHDKLKYKNAIGAWNFKEYPEPIHSPVYRLGHWINESGFVVATNTKEQVTDIRLLGVEAEVELWKEGCVELGLNRYDLAMRVKKCLGEDFVSCKEDGTLTMNGKYNDDSKFDPDGTKQGSKYGGFEIVTCPSDIAVQRERWARIADAADLHNSKGTLLLRAWDTDTCGFHVHVSREALTKLQIGRMLKFINSTKNARFIHKIAGRGSDVFCRYQDKELPDVLHPDRVVAQEEQNAYNRSRRVALNLANDATVEFRIFKGTIHPNHILRNLCFVMAVCDYCYPASRSFADMEDYGKFVYFVTKNVKNSNYKELAAWLIKEGEASKRKIKDGIDPKKLTINPDFVAECDAKMKPTKIAAKKPKSAQDDMF